MTVSLRKHLRHYNRTPNKYKIPKALLFSVFFKIKRIVTIQDISCVGKCTLTVALPIISAMGVEVAVVPTAVRHLIKKILTL